MFSQSFLLRTMNIIIKSLNINFLRVLLKRREIGCYTLFRQLLSYRWSSEDFLLERKELRPKIFRYIITRSKQLFRLSSLWWYYAKKKLVNHNGEFFIVFFSFQKSIFFANFRSIWPIFNSPSFLLWCLLFYCVHISKCHFVMDENYKYERLIIEREKLSSFLKMNYEPTSHCLVPELIFSSFLLFMMNSLRMDR